MLLPLPQAGVAPGRPAWLPNFHAWVARLSPEGLADLIDVLAVELRHRNIGDPEALAEAAETVRKDEAARVGRAVDACVTAPRCAMAGVGTGCLPTSSGRADVSAQSISNTALGAAQATPRSLGEARLALLRGRGESLSGIARDLGRDLSAVSRVNRAQRRSRTIEEEIARRLGLAAAEAFPEWHGGSA